MRHCLARKISRSTLPRASSWLAHVHGGGFHEINWHQSQSHLPVSMNTIQAARELCNLCRKALSYELKGTAYKRVKLLGQKDDLEKCSELTWQHTVSSKDSCATCNENYTRALQIWKPEWGAIPGDMRILATSDGMPIPQNLSLERSAVSFWLLLEPMRQMHDVDGDWEFCLRMRCYRRSSAPRKLCKVLPIRLDYQVDCLADLSKHTVHIL
jgi:hypothetical protein